MLGQIDTNAHNALSLCQYLISFVCLCVGVKKLLSRPNKQTRHTEKKGKKLCGGDKLYMQRTHTQKIFYLEFVSIK